MSRAILLVYYFIGVFLAHKNYQTAPYRIKNPEDVVAYLSHFGYLEETNNKQQGRWDVEKALKEFQSVAHITPVVGGINDRTLNMMNRPRCGNRDDELLEEHENNKNKRHHRRRHRHGRKLTRHTRSIKPSGKKWDKKVLTYRILKFPSHSSLNPKMVQSEFDKAFKYWEKVTNLRFKKVTDNLTKVDIKIKFARGFHGDNESFDGPGKTLAHGFYPVRGAVHFDDQERWTAAKIRRGFFDIRSVAVHEIGHALGLSHSINRDAIMYYQYSGHRSRRLDFKLHIDDVMAIQALYGEKKKSRRVHNNKNNNGMMSGGGIKTTNICEDPTMDAIATLPDDLIYIFKGDYYFRLDSLNDKIAEEYPRLINSTFHHLPSNLDAVITMKNKKTYFFKGFLYWRLSTGTEIDPGYPKSISVHFKNIFNNLNAACVWSGNNAPYFFKGSSYTRYNDNLLMKGYPKLIADHWPGLPNSIDACFQAPNNRTYFFKRNKFWMFHNDASELESFNLFQGYYVSEANIGLVVSMLQQKSRVEDTKKYDIVKKCILMIDCD